MFIPPNSIKGTLKSNNILEGKVRLNASHLIIVEEIATSLFGTDQNVHLIYYKDKRSLMLAPKSNDLFKQLHKASQFMLKDRNLAGDKSIALHEILIDNEVDDTDRALTFQYEKEIGILNVNL